MPAPPTPAPPSPPAPGPAPARDPSPPPAAALGEHELLELLRTRLREGKADPARDLEIAQTYLLEAQPLKAYEALKAVDPSALPSDEARLSWRLAMASSCSRLADFERASDLLKECERAIRPLAPLKLANACFTANPRQRVRIEDPRFRPGEVATVYLDVERLGLALQKDGSAKARLSFDLSLLEPSGRLVADFADWEKAHGTVEESSHHAWEDHAYRLALPLPKGANLGAYLLKVEVSDLSSTPPRKASVSLPLTLR